MKEKPTITFRLGDDFYGKLDYFTEKVLREGYQYFQKEFANIDRFLEKAKCDIMNRSDLSFRQTPKPFYLIEMLYYKIFDEANREEFNKAKDTVLILPDCMSLLLDKCKRERTKFGKRCTRCVPKCKIHEIMLLADKYHIEGYFSKRALTEQIEKIKKKKPSLSVIGISCLLTLASGMRSAKEAGVPSRGVFLNFTGCEHWADKPFPTETAIGRLQSILEEKYGVPDSSS
jgi:hypothetical protein